MAKTKLPFKEFGWTPKLAYAVGLLVTDGNLSKDGRHITMRSAEPELLETFKICLNLKNKVGTSYKNGYSNKPTYRVQFSDVQFYNWLISIGVTPAKTYSIGVLQISEIVFRDFLRGHLDGDGSITSYRDYYNIFKNPKYIYTRLFTRFISASKRHILWLQYNINKTFGVKGRVHRERPADPNKHTDMWTLKFMKKESIKLLNCIYYQEDIPCLERKMIVAQGVLEKISKEERRPYIFQKTRATN